MDTGNGTGTLTKAGFVRVWGFATSCQQHCGVGVFVPISQTVVGWWCPRAREWSR